MHHIYYHSKKKADPSNKVKAENKYFENRVPAKGDTIISFTVFLRPNKQSGILAPAHHFHEAEKKIEALISRRAYNKNHKTENGAFRLMHEFASKHHFEVVNENEIERWIILKGQIKDIEKAFKIDIKAVKYEDEIYYFFEGQLKISKALEHIIESISGLNTIPIKADKIFPKELNIPGSMLEGRAVLPQDYAKLYNFPKDLDGSGQCIAIISFGGGYNKRALKAYFERIGIPMPEIYWRSVDGGKNEPYKNPKHDYEVYMDIEIAASLAPGAKIVVYFAENNNYNIAKAIKRAIHDRRHRPTIISMSWGALEFKFNQDEKETLDRVLHEAASLNITVITSSGDLGSSGLMKNVPFLLNVQLPASHPLVLAVGGTQVHEQNGLLIDEHAWEQKQKIDGKEINAKSGGGFSLFWDLPSYQEGSLPEDLNMDRKRGIPDVAANASTEPGILLFVHKFRQISIGTSAAVPLWAALIARINQHLNNNGLPNAGFINPILYHDEVKVAFNEVDHGDNGAYQARVGWDPCTGLGTPDGMKILKAVTALKKKLGYDKI